MAYDRVPYNFTPRPLLSFTLLLKDVDESVVHDFAGGGLWKSSHGFSEWSREDTAWNMESISLC